MEKRRLGKTGQMSTVLAFGGAAVGKVTQDEADRAIELAIVEHGVNHIDVAPSYGEAELRLGPWLQRHNKEVFLGCKTTARDKVTAWESIKRSLERLRVDHFDLFQFHAVDDLETLNIILGPGGALEAVLEAKEQGLLKFIGITGHRPYVHVEALNRFDFDTVLFPLSRVHAGHLNDFNNFVPLIQAAKTRDVGLISIKAISKRNWPGTNHNHGTWYEPFDTQEEIDRSLWYTLSLGVTTAPMASDLALWPMLLSAAGRYKPMSQNDQNEAIKEVEQYRPIASPGD
jgi:aryl-alcohol dehydrogenase-like predicted oxidoreductase